MMLMYFANACHAAADGRFCSGSGGSPAAVMGKIQSALTDELRKPKYRGNPNLQAGQCYVATEAMFHLLGGKEAGYKPMYIKHEGEPHWFLQGPKGRIYDPTASQFDSPVPYDKGVGKGFLTKEPSARARTLMDRL